MSAPDSARIHGFEPLAAPGARVLVLGSMPSSASLAKHQYYAHPRNVFWPIMSSMFGIRSLGYEERAREVTARGIAIWDVLSDCIRPGSLDSAIDERTAAANDFKVFFAQNPLIHQVFFNGAKAESMYVRRVLPKLDPASAAIPRERLPSTSPANAGMSFEEKLSAWRIALEDALKRPGSEQLSYSDPMG